MMRMIRDWGLALVVGVVVFVVADRLGQPSKQAVGEPAPDFALVNLATGGTTSLSELRGSTVVLNFWATWCGPCKRELPEFSAYAKEHPEVKLLGIVVPSNEGSRLPEIVGRFKIAYPVLVADAATEAAYRVDSFPTTFIVRADGSVGTVQVGGMNKEMLAELVEQYGG